MAVGVAALLVTIVTLFGAQILRVLRVRLRLSAEGPLCAMALGSLAVAYVIFAIGMLGWLTRPALIAVLGAALLAGLPAAPGLVRQLGSYLLRLVRALRRWQVALAVGGVVLWVLLALPEASCWPTSRDWDGLSQHLVYADTYLRHHAIRPLWYDHHSQFPQTLQMLYVPALAFGGPAAPRLVHMAFGLLCLALVYLLTRRHVSSDAAVWAPVIVVGTPVFGWMATVTYVDLGVCAYVLLSLHLLLVWFGDGSEGGRRPEQLVLAALFGGASMAVKMQGIAYFGVFVLALAAICWRRRIGWWRPTVTYALIGMALAAPWYIKSWVLTGNPVYPFAYSIFGGKLWSAQDAAQYSAAQKSYGMGGRPPAPGPAPKNPIARAFSGPRRPDRLLLAPVYLTLFPWEFEDNMGTRMSAYLLQGPGPYYLAFLPLLLGWRRSPRAVGLLMWLFAPLWVWWLHSMQLGRYLLPTLMIVAPAAAYSFHRCLGAHTLLRAVAWAVMASGLAVRGWATLLLVPVGLSAQVNPQAAYERMLAFFDVYEPSLYISRELPADAKILTLGEPRVFYFGRDVMWGDPGHSQLIPYDRIHTVEQLIAAYRSLGVTHVFINTFFVPGLERGGGKLEALLREGMARGLLVPIRRSVEPTPRFRHFLLLRIADPATEGVPNGGGLP